MRRDPCHWIHLRVSMNYQLIFSTRIRVLLDQFHRCDVQRHLRCPFLPNEMPACGNSPRYKWSSVYALRLRSQSLRPIPRQEPYPSPLADTATRPPSPLQIVGASWFWECCWKDRQRLKENSFLWYVHPDNQNEIVYQRPPPVHCHDRTPRRQARLNLSVKHRNLKKSWKLMRNQNPSTPDVRPSTLDL